MQGLPGRGTGHPSAAGAAPVEGDLEHLLLSDLVIVDGDPTRDITVLQYEERIVAVMKDGRLVTDLLR